MEVGAAAAGEGHREVFDVLAVTLALCWHSLRAVSFTCPAVLLLS